MTMALLHACVISKVHTCLTSCSGIVWLLGAGSLCDAFKVPKAYVN